MDIGRPRRTLGIIGCEVLLYEIAHVISSDERISSVIVIDSPESVDLHDRLRRIAPYKRIELRDEEELEKMDSNPGPEVVVRLMPISLHQGPAELRERVLAEARKMERTCGSILVFYGLCGNAFREIDRLTSGFTVPVTILRDGKNLIVDDCVGAVLGGTEEYLAYLRSEDGEYPLNARWAEKWRYYMHETQLLRDENDIEDAKTVFKCMGYSRVAKLETGLADEEEFERRAREFAELFELDVECVRCPLRVVEDSYRAAMARIL